MIEEKLTEIEELLEELACDIDPDEYTWTEEELEWGNGMLRTISKAQRAVRKLKKLHVVEGDKCLVVSPEDFEQAGYLVCGKSRKELEELARRVAKGIGNNDLVMDCFWQHVDIVAEDAGMVKYDGEKYALCQVVYKDTGESFEDYIKMNEEVDEKTDDKIFFNCAGLEELISLTDKNNGEDFYIKEVLEFSDEIG